MEENIVKVYKEDEEDAKIIFKRFCVSATNQSNGNASILEYKITGMKSFIAGFFSNAVDKRGFLKLNASPRFV